MAATVVQELLDVASESAERCREIARPQIGSRVAVAVLAPISVSATVPLWEARAPRPLAFDEMR